MAKKSTRKVSQSMKDDAVRLAGIAIAAIDTLAEWFPRSGSWAVIGRLLDEELSEIVAIPISDGPAPESVAAPME